LCDQFGLHVLLERRVITPTVEFFPDPWDHSDAAIKKMFRRVCQYMLVPDGEVELELFNDSTARPMAEAFGFAAGTWQTGDYGPNRIRMERGGMYDPSALIGVMAHELAHQKLLGEHRFDGDAFDNEMLTDLTAVFFGFGVFLANNPHKSSGELLTWPGTRDRRTEYLSNDMLGYAMAHIAWHRDEEKPEWGGHLRWAPRAEFQAGLRFLKRTADSTFLPIRLR